MFTVDVIEPGVPFIYQGDVTINCSIPDDTDLKITDGTLLIKGNVGERCHITIKVTLVYQTHTSTRGGMQMTSMVQQSVPTKLTLEGSCGSDTTIDTMDDIEIKGAVGSKTKIKTINGNIRASDIGSNATLTSKNGTITVGNVEPKVRISTHNGNVHALNLGAGAKLKTLNGTIFAQEVEEGASMQTSLGGLQATQVGPNAVLETALGNIQVRSADPTATLDTGRGDISVNGIVRQKKKPAPTLVYYGTIGSLKGHIQDRGAYEQGSRRPPNQHDEYAQQRALLEDEKAETCCCPFSRKKY